MRTALLRAGVTTVTAGVLALATVMLPRDDCSASAVGNCVEVGSRAFDEHVDRDETASLPWGDVRLDQVAAGSAVTRRSVDDGVLTAPRGAAYLVVDVTATVRDRARTLRAVLHSDDLELRNTVDDAQVTATTIPGVPVSSRIVFLVPGEVLEDDGLTLEMDWGSGDAARFTLGAVETGPTIAAKEAS